MKRYAFESDRLQKKIYISMYGFLGRRRIKTFSETEYQRAMEYLKQLASRNRPSRVSVLDGQGNVSRQWEYKVRPKPKSYETKPRKIK